MPTSILRLFTAVLAATVLFAVLPPATASASTRTAEETFVDKINAERRKAGLKSLVESAQMSRIARGWSKRMATGEGLAHNPYRSAQVQGPWRRLGENVGVSRSGGSESEMVNRLHAALMKSSGHRKNILGQYNQVGIGVVVRNGSMWVTQNFLNGPVGAFPLFSDTAGSEHEDSVEAIWLDKITNGCKRGSAYCPTRAVTRAQMASFLSRALGLSTSSTSSGFRDVGGVHAGSVAALAKAGIADGCGSRKFCPDEPVSRAQMATFLVRAIDSLEPTSGSRFADVPSSYSHASSVNALAKAGISTGCSGSRFCPAQRVTRAQMATFLARALNL